MFSAEMSTSRRPNSFVVTIAKAAVRPWWWKYLDHQRLPCGVGYHPLVLPGGRPKKVFSRPFFAMCVQCVATFVRARRERWDYIYTFECDWPTFIFAGLQTLFRLRRPRHVVLQFIMREKTASLPSRLKYAFMRWCFSSIHLCICSSRPEGAYYVRTFGWAPDKVAYVPLHIDPELLAVRSVQEDGYVVSAGRTFRDYATLLESFSDLTTPLLIVAGRGAVPEARPSNVRVVYELPQTELIDAMAASQIVVLPLEERQISTGQMVLLQAMSLGKPVIVTSVNGTVDYVEHMKTGILVPPRDAAAIRDAVCLLASDASLRARLGAAARARMEEAHLPVHYAVGVAQALRGPLLEKT